MAELKSREGPCGEAASRQREEAVADFDPYPHCRNPRANEPELVDKLSSKTGEEGHGRLASEGELRTRQGRGFC